MQQFSRLTKAGSVNEFRKDNSSPETFMRLENPKYSETYLASLSSPQKQTLEQQKDFLINLVWSHGAIAVSFILEPFKKFR